MSRRPLAKVRAFIHQELDFCIQNLPEEQTVHIGAVTKYTAMTLKAKLALLESDFDAVLTLTNAIIANAGYELYGMPGSGEDYYNLFKIPGKLAKESIYEFQYTDFGSGDGQIVHGWAWFDCQGPANNTPPIAGWGFMLAKPDFYNFMTSRNEQARFNVSLLESGATTPAGDPIALFEPTYLTIKAYYNGKAYLPANQMTSGRMGYGMGNNIRLFRYADVLLMNAEAKVRLGGEAAEPLNAVRRRAGLPDIATPSLDDVLDERRAELCCEWGSRYQDSLRTGAVKELPGFTEGKEYLPIPMAQEDLNPKLKLPPVE